jgi:hypothetical protein
MFLSKFSFQEIGKCLPKTAPAPYGYRRRRQAGLDGANAEYDQIYNTEKDQRAATISVNQLNKLEGVCHKFVDAFFEIDELKECNKYGAWKKRAEHLLGDMTAMKNICLKIRQDGGAGY